MKWSELDQVARTWTLAPERTKNKRGHVIYISDAFDKILDSIPMRGDFVFSKGKTPPSGFSRAKRRLDRMMDEYASNEFEKQPEPFTIHDLRRTCASGMAKLKINLATVELCLNHWSGELGGLREVYVQHDQAEQTRDAFELWAAHVTKIVGTNP